VAQDLIAVRNADGDSHMAEFFQAGVGRARGLDCGSALVVARGRLGLGAAASAAPPGRACK
jgi:hypothetical protein